MKVVQTTDTLLVIEDRPWLLWILLPILGLPALFAAATGQVGGVWPTLLVGGMGVVSLWVLHHFAPFQRFRFNRSTGLLTHHVYRLTGSGAWEVPLSDIRRAVDQGHHSDGTRMSRVTLLTVHGTHPLESGYTNRNIKPVVKAINDWLGVDDH